MLAPLLLGLASLIIAKHLTSPSSTSAPSVAGVPSQIFNVSVPPLKRSVAVPLGPQTRFLTAYDTNLKASPSIHSREAVILLESANDRRVAVIRGDALLASGNRIAIPAAVTQVRIDNLAQSGLGIAATLVIE